MVLCTKRKTSEAGDNLHMVIGYKRTSTSALNHSNLKASTGFILEALYEWKNTVAITTRAATTKETTKIHGEMDVLKEKLFNHLLIK